jgi:1-deoxy-D-xylulose-5-phosphate synthase
MDIEEIKKSDINQLKEKAQKIRELLIDTVSKTGGHLGSNLGIVELTMAVHKVFNSPEDKIIFDVGHQSYVHKILTGREEKFCTLRKKDGIAPFTDPNESIHDPFISGHAGTALSAAAGIAIANPDKKIIAIIGDASIANGHSLEALNHIGGAKIKNLIVILNDNERSIGKNVGSLSNFFGRIMSSTMYLNLREEISNFIKRGKLGIKVTDVLERLEHSVKNFFAPMSVSENLGFKFLGAIDGHNFDELLQTLEKCKVMEGPIFIHVKTQKGKGYIFAEENQEKFHGIAPFDPETGNVKNSGLSYSKIYGQKIVEMAKSDKDIYAISAAMVKGTDLTKFFEEFPERAIDVGIAEGHAVTFSGGLASAGKKPYLSVYSTFLQRGFSQLIHDISLQKLPVKFIVDRAGIVGEDGKTHHGLYDISYFMTVPNFVIIAPTSGQELEEALEISKNYTEGPLVIRIPRENNFKLEGQNSFEIGVWKEVIKGENNLFIATGSMLKEILEVLPILEKRGMGGTVISAASIKPLDEAFIMRHFLSYENIFVLEEGYTKNAFGTSVIDFLNSKKIEKSIFKIGIDTGNVPHGMRKELLEQYGLKGISLVNRIEGCIKCN